MPYASPKTRLMWLQRASLFLTPFPPGMCYLDDNIWSHAFEFAPGILRLLVISILLALWSDLHMQIRQAELVDKHGVSLVEGKQCRILSRGRDKMCNVRVTWQMETAKGVYIGYFYLTRLTLLTVRRYSEPVEVLATPVGHVTLVLHVGAVPQES